MCLLQNFPQFIVIHTVKGFGIVNIAEIDVFLELSCFFNDPADVGNHISLLQKTFILEGHLLSCLPGIEKCLELDCGLKTLPDIQAGFRKGRGTRDQIANILWIIEKAREFQED